MTKHKKAEWYCNGCNLPDGPCIDSDGNICHIKNGKWHREDGPAVEWANGDKFWCINDRYHRDGGPAKEFASGHKEWWVNGKWHRTKKAYLEASKIWKINEAMK